MANATTFEYRIELFTNAEALNKIGAEGWDLVCPGGKEGNYLIFKREIGETRKKIGGDDGMPVKTSKKKSYKDFL
jgi:hypothetical protein